MKKPEHGGTCRLDQLTSLLPDLILSGISVADPDGTIRLVVTVDRPGDPDPDVRVMLRVTAAPADPVSRTFDAPDQLPARPDRLDRRRRLGRRDAEFLHRVSAEIDAHVAEEGFDVPRLARSLHVSPSQLGRRLRALVDRSPGELIRIARLLHARELVEHGDGSLSTIAHACGFSDHAHLSRTFRRYFGTTPSELRRARRSPSRLPVTD